MCPSGQLSLHLKANQQQLEQKKNRNPQVNSNPRHWKIEKECLVDPVYLICKRGNQKICNPSSLNWRSTAQRGILSVSMGIYFCTGERLLDAGVRFSCSSWKRLNVSSLSARWWTKQTSQQQTPTRSPRKKPLHDWSEVIREAFVERFPGPALPPLPAHPPTPLRFSHDVWGRSAASPSGTWGKAAAWADANRAQEPVEKSKTVSPSLGAGPTSLRDAAFLSSIGGKQRGLLAGKRTRRGWGQSPGREQTCR